MAHPSIAPQLAAHPPILYIYMEARAPEAHVLVAELLCVCGHQRHRLYEVPGGMAWRA